MCDELRARYGNWDDERIYHTARLIVSALIAKIHTVEWTPAILATKAIEVGLSSNWNGPPANDYLTKLGLWLLDPHASTGIPKTLPDHHAAPYSLTEDFVTVYRLHPLLPDDYCFYNHKTGEKIAEKGFMDIQGGEADDAMRAVRPAQYALFVRHRAPGAIALHNFPKSLIKLQRDNEIIDLSVVDIVRTRRRGVPRYNDFRAGLHRPRVTRWEDLATDPEDQRLLKEIYGDIDKVDTVVGLTAEPAPAGFGFSDTAFRIFILMASRRLQSDRFLTVDFRPEIYSPFGIDWIANNGMTSLILRHCPELASMLPRTASAFAPWRPIVPPTSSREARGAHHDQAGRNCPPSRSRCRRGASTGNAGLDGLLGRPLIETIWRRRTHRVSQGSSVLAGSMSYESKHPHEPLSELEEAVLIAMTGCTGLTMPDRPFEDPATRKPVMAKPNLTMAGRTAGSPDNAQGTHFFMINDSGTYFLRKLPPVADAFSAERLIERAREAKVRILDRRLDVPDGKRDFPAYLDSNRFLSNQPGTTIFLPVVDLSRQYINGMMYILTQPDGARPTIVDDRNFYRPAGVKRWVDKGFLNKDLKVPLGAIGSLRTQIEADLLLQNLFLTADAMGLGGWIHASVSPPILVGDPKFSQDLRPDAGLRRRHAALAAHGSVALARAAAALFQPAQQSDRPALQGRASDQGHVAALLRHDGRCGRGRGRFEIRQGRHLLQREAVCRNLQGRFRPPLSLGSRGLQRRRDRLRARHLHLHLRNARPFPRALRRNPRARRLAAGAPCRHRLLRALLPQRADGCPPQPSPGLGSIGASAPSQAHRADSL